MSKQTVNELVIEQRNFKTQLSQLQAKISEAYEKFDIGMDDLANELYDEKEFTEKNFSILRTKLQIVAEILESNSIQA